MRVGFIGTGNIGRPMASQIAAAGFPLVVHDRRREAAAPLLDSGARWAETPSSVAMQSDIVCTCLPGPTEMEQVMLGEDGVASGLASGSIYVDHTTNSADLVRRVHGILAKKDVGMIDAPVSGGMEGAQTRDLTLLVGGDAEVLHRARPVLDAIGKTVLHVGDIGAGNICKVLHNAAGFTRALAMMECLTVGVKAGIDPGVLVEVFQKCALGRSFDLQVRLPSTLFKGSFDPARFALGVAAKDMGLAAELAAANDVPAELMELCRAQMAEAMSRGWADRDSSVYLTLQEERADARVRTSE